MTTQPPKLHEHYLCLCTDGRDLDVRIETTIENMESAIMAVRRALVERGTIL
jgi:hypothetical protein